MTTVEDLKVGSAGHEPENVDESEHELDPEFAIEQVVVANQERAKELTEKAAAVTDPIEREALLRQALDHEVQARVQSEIAQGLSSEAPLNNVDQEVPELALEIGLEALSGPLLDVASPDVLKEALVELEGGLNADAVGGFFFDQEVSNIRSPSDAGTPTGTSLEPALPAIDEVLKETGTSAVSIPNVTTEGQLGPAEASPEAAEQPKTPFEHEERAVITESVADEETVRTFQPDEELEIRETTEVTITKVESPDNGSPTRKPKTLEINSKKKPRKLEIRSTQQSP